MALKFDPNNPEALLIELVQPRSDWLGMDSIVSLLPRLVKAF